MLGRPAGRHRGMTAAASGGSQRQARRHVLGTQTHTCMCAVDRILRDGLVALLLLLVVVQAPPPAGRNQRAASTCGSGGWSQRRTGAWPPATSVRDCPVRCVKHPVTWVVIVCAALRHCVALGRRLSLQICQGTVAGPLAGFSNSQP